jgi:hypothetical protein
VEEDELGGACCTFRGEKKCTQDFVRETRVQETKMVLKWI